MFPASVFEPGGFSVHVHQTNSQLVSDLHLRLPHQLTDVTKGKATLFILSHYVASVCEILLISCFSPQNFIAIIPLVIYVSSFVCSLVMKPVSKRISISVSVSVFMDFTWFIIRLWICRQ